MNTSPSKPLRWILVTLRVILGAVFIYGGYLKVQAGWPLFAMSIDSYHIVPLRYIEPLARSLPWFEVLLGVWLIAGIWLRVSSTLISLTLAIFFTAMVHAELAGQKIDCGCFGPGEPISKWTLLRDGSLLAAAVFVTVMAFVRPSRRRMA
jgi:uncharacterized membrane protein YphA (DoxX/SURF4 family)